MVEKGLTYRVDALKARKRLRKGKKLGTGACKSELTRQREMWEEEVKT